jgi:multiple sugar transport system substrate-binding protein
VLHFNKKLFDARGVKYPHKGWTYDDLLQAAQRFTDPAGDKYGIQVAQNGLHYMMGTFVLNFGGKLLNETRDRALYGDDPNAIRGVEFDVDLHTRYRVAPTAAALAALPPGRMPMELGMVPMELNGLQRHAAIRDAIGAEALDFAPPPKGPTGIQTAAVGGNGWGMLALSKAKDAAWSVLRWMHTRDGLFKTRMLQIVAWPPTQWAAEAPQWLDQFKGTRIADCTAVWRANGHDFLPMPESDNVMVMNGPMNRALAGEMSTRDAMRESARQLNELIARRPAHWR